jgi:hypothetical protein
MYPRPRRLYVGGAVIETRRFLPWIFRRPFTPSLTLSPPRVRKRKQNHRSTDIKGLSVYSSAKGCWISRGMARTASGGSKSETSFSGFSGFPGFSSFLFERAGKS